MIRNFRKPLVIAAPKTLLRLSAATSTLEEMGPDTNFKPVLADPEVKSNFDAVKKVILVSGKHFYFLNEKRKELNIKDVAIIRLESLCPFPALELQREVEKFKNLKGKLTAL